MSDARGQFKVANAVGARMAEDLNELSKPIVLRK